MVAMKLLQLWFFWKKGRKIKEKMISKVSGKGGDDCRISTGPGRRRRFTDDVAFFLATVPRWPRRRRRRFSEKEKKTSHFSLFCCVCVCAVVNGGTERGCLHHPMWRDHPHQVPLSTVPPTVFISRLWKEPQWYTFTYGGKSSKIAQQLVKLEKRENSKTPNFSHPQHLESKRSEFDWTSQHEKREKREKRPCLIHSLF